MHVRATSLWYQLCPGNFRLFIATFRNITVFGLGKSKSVVGLDIGSSAVKAVELKPAGKGYRVAAFATEPVPPDSIVDGAIIDGTAVAEAIRRVFEQQGLQDQGRRGVALGQRRHRQENQPAGHDRGRSSAESIYWEAEQYIPFDIQDVNLDYQILDPARAPTSRAPWKCCWWRRRKKDRRLHRRHRPGRAHRRWSSTWTRSRCRTPTKRTTASSRGQVVVLLNAGASAININILNGDQSVFTRDISIGGNAYTEALQKELDAPVRERRAG